MEINNIKIGNILNYTTAEGDVLPTKIDWQDLKWIDEDPEGFSLVHSPIELTASLMIHMRFREEYNGDHSVFEKDGVCFYMDGNGAAEFMTSDRYCVEYLHEVQNIYFALTREEIYIELNEINKEPEKDVIDDLRKDIPF